MKEFEKGQSLLEIVFAFAVMALVVMAIVGLAVVSVRNSSYSRNKTLATKHLQTIMEKVRDKRDVNWEEFVILSTSAGKIYCINDLSNIWENEDLCTDGERIVSTGPFYANLTMTSVESINGNYVNASLEISWEDSQGVHTIRSTSDFTNWQAK